MKAKKITARNIKDAMKIAVKEVGDDAIVVSKREVPTGVEIVVASESDYEKAKNSLMENGKIKGDGNIVNYTSKPTKSTIDAWNQYEASSKKTDAMAGFKAKKMEDGRKGEVAYSMNDIKTAIKNDTSEVVGAIVAEVKDLKDVIMEQVNLKLAEQDEMILDIRMIRDSFDSAYKRNYALSHANAVYEMLYSRMERLGVSEDVKISMTAGIEPTLEVREAWKHSLVNLSNSIVSNQGELLSKGGIYAFLGATGVGKTTTIGKLATRYVMEHGIKDIALITTDSFKIASFEQLKTFGRILDIPVYAVSERDSLKKIIDELKDKKLILIDTSGMNLDGKVTEIQNRMISEASDAIKKMVVISSSAQKQVIEKSWEAYEDNGIDGLVLTKLDESSSIGAAISLAVEKRIPINYVSDGQRIPDDCHILNNRELVLKAVEISQKETDRIVSKVTG